MSTTGVIRLPYPHKGQQLVRKQSKRHNWLSAGRRWRKTTLLTAITIEAAAKGGQYVWGAPTFDQVRIAFREAKRAAVGVADFNQSLMTATMPSGGIIFYRSLDDPDNARGLTANGVVIDECADVKAEAWYEVLRPMLIDTGGWSWGIGTPKGRNWFFQEHISALDRSDSASWQVPTVGSAIIDGELVRKPHPMENPEIDFDEIVRLFETMPLRTFQQEILAEFLEGEGAVFRNIPACHTLQPSTPEHHRGHTIIAGCDWGKQQDYTAFSFGCLDCRQEVAHDRFNQIDYAFQAQRLKAMCDVWKPATVLTELNSIGQPVFEQLQRSGLPAVGFNTTAQTKPPLIENLALTLERSEWKFLNDKVWVAELEAYERKVSAATGRSQYSAPDGLNDDTVMAKALMVWQANSARPSTSYSFQQYGYRP